MRFMMLMIPRGYETAKPGTVPDVKAVKAMMEYNRLLQKAGVLRSLDGLHPPAEGVRVTFSGGRAQLARGPFPNVQEPLGGYWVLEVKSQEEAVEWAKRCPASENEIIEIRQIQEFAEFPAEVRAAAPDFSEMERQFQARPKAA
ncbi:MAG: YciI family protein [Kiritimatiellaeota bacterium]|nr:YciI family protein [Kiritimatiellota bacterium]